MYSNDPKRYSLLTRIQYATVGGQYNIAAQYCEPDSGPADTLQVLTHGIGFDRTYWDLPAKNYNYSYVNEAVDQYGYSTFAWDRLGIGESSHGNPLTEIQALLEVDALRALTVDLRAGKVKGISKAYEKVVHIGHSFGSQHTYALTAMYPDLSDGIALTGFSQNGSFAAFFLLGGNFIEANNVPAFSSLPDGYFAGGDKTAVHINFFSPGDFDPAILTYAYKNGQPVTVGELLSFGGETASINKFAGPVHIVTGERDVPYCGGNCLAAPDGLPNIPSSSKEFFPNAEDFKVTIIPGAGHGLNLEYTWPITYASVNDYFVQNGLAASSGGSGHGGGYKHNHHGPPR
jgi:pimeloyl-ACP methyl ester carboxylesterase